VRGCEQENQLALVLYLALFCIWLTRRVLWLLMAIGHVLSCVLLRQMEYDADRYEARLAGTDAFAETTRKITLLGLVTNSAFEMAAGSWIMKGRLPDDLSTLILTMASGISKKESRKIEKELEKSKTSFFDTHPAHGERVASVQRENAPGVFHLEDPASQLFKDFSKMSRDATLELYREVFGKRVKRDSLVPVATFLGTGEAKETQRAE
jgi:hypothetical protein